MSQRRLSHEGGNPSSTTTTTTAVGEISFSPLEIEEPNTSLVEGDNTADEYYDESESELVKALVGGSGLDKSPSDPDINHSNGDGNGGDNAHDHHGAGPPGSASTPQVIVNIIISFVGAGLLAVPNAFSQSGWLLGTVTLLTVSAFNVYAMLCLPQVQKLLQKRHPSETIQSYGDLGRVILGKQGEKLVFVCLGISQAGFATAYIIFIAANLKSIYGWSRLAICVGCIPGLVGLVQFRELSSLSPFSMLANAANFCALSAVLFQDYEHYTPHNDTIHKANTSGMLHVIAITIYSMEGVGLILSLKSSCKRPQDFSFLLIATLTVISLFMVVFGSAGYWAFGAATMAPVTLNMANHWSSTFVKCALCLGLYLTFPVMMVPIWNIIEPPTIHWRKRLLLRTSIVLCSAGVAYLIPNFGKFLALVGSSICTLLGFVFPSYFHLYTVGKELPFHEKVIDVCLLVGGLSFGCFETYRSIIDMMAGELEGH
jgi:proton-coupled amino acid transporter